MDPLSPLPAVAALLTVIGTTFALVKWFGVPTEEGRFATIDGLRGYLAFFVFLHHSSIWYFYLRTSTWKVPSSNLYTHFGQSSVALFFMITAFLFFSKLLEGRTKRIDWPKLFVSRFLRLVPLYLFAMFLLLVVVGYVSGGQLNESALNLGKGIVRWLSFTIAGNPDLNGVEHTSRIIAGVTWSLPYEWFFYFSLPVLALAVGAQPPRLYVVLGVAWIACWVLWDPAVHHVASFLGGIAAALAYRLDWFRRIAATKGASLVSIACIAAAIMVYPTADSAGPLILLSMAFAFIACGSDLFGVLVSPISRSLGEVAYSIYLLHGIALYVVFSLVLGATRSSALSPVQHWFVVIVITPILITGCFLTFRVIERPAMQQVARVTTWMRSCSLVRGRTTPRNA